MVSFLAGLNTQMPRDVASTLAAISVAAGEHLPEVIAEVESSLLRSASFGPGPLSDPAKATVCAGGKRLRPLLLAITAGEAACAEAQSRELVVRGGVAVELIHTATLVHDDVLDQAPLRRGKPTVYSDSGRAAATALGDAVFAAAFAQVAALGKDAQVPLQVLASASTALAHGELIQRADSWDLSTTKERYIRRCELKTAALFEAAARLGADAASEDPEPFATFARGIGVAFQLFDDILDVEAPPEQTGKPRGTDLLDGTVTLPLILAMENDPELAALDMRGISSHDEAAQICDRISAAGGVKQTLSEAKAMVELALDALPSDLDASRRAALELIAAGVVDRRL